MKNLISFFIVFLSLNVYPVNFALSQETTYRKDENCFNYLEGFSEFYLEMVFSKCLYACYRALEDCPDTEKDPGPVCKKLVSVLKISASTKFSDCVYQQELDLMLQYDKMEKKINE